MFLSLKFWANSDLAEDGFGPHGVDFGGFLQKRQGDSGGAIERGTQVDGSAFAVRLDGAFVIGVGIFSIELVELRQPFEAKRGRIATRFNGTLVGGFGHFGIGGELGVGDVDFGDGGFDGVFAEIALRIERAARDGGGLPVGLGEMVGDFLFKCLGCDSKGVALGGSQGTAAAEGVEKNMEVGLVFELGGDEMDAGPGKVRVSGVCAPGDFAAVGFEGIEELLEPDSTSGGRRAVLDSRKILATCPSGRCAPAKVSNW